MTLNVFISFAKEDKSQVSRLEEIVRHGGGRGWQFVYDLYGARDWATEIQYKIDQCEVFLFVITNNSLQSEWCLKEFQHAALSQKPIVTVVFTSDIDIPHPLNTIQYILFDESPESAAKLVHALTDPRPLGQDKIPSSWERLGADPVAYHTPPHYQSRNIPIPRLQRELTDIEKEDFLHEAMSEIRSYFANALHAFESSDSRVITRIRDESTSDFSCLVYIDGNIFKSCRIRISNELSLSGIAYSATRGNLARFGSGGINELVQVSILEGSPALEFVMDFMTSSGSRICSVSEASERLWKLFTNDFTQDDLRW